MTPETVAAIGDEELLIAGVRPEHFEDASIVDEAIRPHGMEFDVEVDVVEWLGNEQYAYVPFEPPAEIAGKLAELQAETDSESLRTQLVVALDTASRITDNQSTRLFMDVRKMHLFVPETGENLASRVPA